MLTRVRHWFTCQRLRRELGELSRRMDALSRRLDRLEADIAALHERLDT